MAPARPWQSKAVCRNHLSYRIFGGVFFSATNKKNIGVLAHVERRLSTQGRGYRSQPKRSTDEAELRHPTLILEPLYTTTINLH